MDNERPAVRLNDLLPAAALHCDDNSMSRAVDPGASPGPVSVGESNV
jgi:hypothetical protein